SPDHQSYMSFVLGGHQTSPPLQPFPQTALVRIPTPRSWEIPAHVLFGFSGDGVPTPEQIIAVARDWHERYGADICAVGHLALEFRVQRPPADRREAVRLLREHLLFSSLISEAFGGRPDMLHEYLRDTLAELPRQTYWQFGWEI